MSRVGMNKTEEKTSLVCSNKACGKVFAKPLKTINIHEGSKEHYDACPYCLTKIVNVEIENNISPEETVAEAKSSKEKPSRKEEKTSSCKYYRGFLSEKEHKQNIPEECMVCIELIECMRKK
jgi:predicted DNA-binding antitoxin AbrB/MazE fold protein